MSNKLKFSSIAAFGVTFFAGGIAYAASPVSGFGPTISGDRSLNENLGALTEVIAWQNSPMGDVYQFALAVTAPETPFENVAMESTSQDSLATGPQIINDRTLNGSMQHLATVIAYQKSPQGDAFQYALEEHLQGKGADFEQVALASIPAGGFDRGR